MNIFNLVKTFSSELYTYIKKGTPNVSEDEYKKRLETCVSCEHFKENNATCNMCGCYMPSKAKWATSACPKNKWEEIKKK